MRIMLASVFLLIVTGCNRHSCPVDSSVRQEYFHHLQVVEGFQKGESTFVEDYRRSIFYLDFLTGIQSKADFSSTLGFENNREYRHDMKLWKEWYKKNKCILTRQYVDSTLRRYNYRYKAKE